MPCFIGCCTYGEANVPSTTVKTFGKLLPSFPNSIKSTTVMSGLHGVSQYNIFLKKAHFSFERCKKNDIREYYSCVGFH